MEIQENIPLSRYTTFHIGGNAKYFCVCNTLFDLQKSLDFAKQNNLEIFVLGEGSNVLVSDKGFNGLVIKPLLKKIDFRPDDSHVLVTLGAGEHWDDVVALCVSKGYWGIENLSHIPGSCGALAVQNVGAYGQQISDVIESVEVFDIEKSEVSILTNKDCLFTYRHSIFNTSHKGKYIILSITIKLSLVPSPCLEYGDIKKYFSDLGILQPTQQQIRDAVIAIRNTKFPYPHEAKNGNAGSFFRGPIISEEQMENIKDVVENKFGAEASLRLTSMKDRLQVAQGFKTPVAFFMELCNLKGYQVRGAQINQSQPAIVLNVTGSASAHDVLQIRDRVFKEVKETFGVDLEVEPELIGF